MDEGDVKAETSPMLEETGWLLARCIHVYVLQTDFAVTLRSQSRHGRRQRYPVYATIIVADLLCLMRFRLPLNKYTWIDCQIVVPFYRDQPSRTKYK